MRFKAVLLSLILICAFTLNPRRLAVADGGTVSVPAAVVITFVAATALVFVVDPDTGERMWKWGERTAGDIWEVLEDLPVLFVTHGKLHGLSSPDTKGTLLYVEGDTVTANQPVTFSDFQEAAEQLHYGDTSTHDRAEGTTSGGGTPNPDCQPHDKGYEKDSYYTGRITNRNGSFDGAFLFTRTEIVGGVLHYVFRYFKGGNYIMDVSAPKRGINFDPC